MPRSSPWPRTVRRTISRRSAPVTPGGRCAATAAQSTVPPRRTPEQPAQDRPARLAVRRREVDDGVEPGRAGGGGVEGRRVVRAGQRQHVAVLLGAVEDGEEVGQRRPPGARLAVAEVEVDVLEDDDARAEVGRLPVHLAQDAGGRGGVDDDDGELPREFAGHDAAQGALADPGRPGQQHPAVGAQPMLRSRSAREVRAATLASISVHTCAGSTRSSRPPGTQRRGFQLQRQVRVGVQDPAAVEPLVPPGRGQQGVGDGPRGRAWSPGRDSTRSDAGCGSYSCSASCTTTSASVAVPAGKNAAADVGTETCSSSRSMRCHVGGSSSSTGRGPPRAGRRGRPAPPHRDGAGVRQVDAFGHERGVRHPQVGLDEPVRGRRGPVAAGEDLAEHGQGPADVGGFGGQPTGQGGGETVGRVRGGGRHRTTLRPVGRPGPGGARRGGHVVEGGRRGEPRQCDSGQTTSSARPTSRPPGGTRACASPRSPGGCRP